MKKGIVLLVLLVVCAFVRAQFDPQIGQYMYIPTAYNPAAAGEGDMMKVAGLHRMQNVNMTNAPMTTYFTFCSPFVIGKTKHGAGVRFMNDQFGLFSAQTLHAQYAYRQRLGKGYLSAGIDLGFVSIGFKGDSVNLDQLSDEYHNSNDQAVPRGDKSGMNFDLGLGIYYTTNTWWVGASYSHLTAPHIEWDEFTGVRVRGTMYVAAGYNWQLKHHKDWWLRPSVIAMSDFRSWDVNLTMMCDYKNRYRWGAGYRIAGSVNLLFNVDIINGLTLGYTCELPTSKLLLESYGSHEIYLAYAFDILRPKRTNRYKSVRYL